MHNTKVDRRICKIYDRREKKIHVLQTDRQKTKQRNKKDVVDRQAEEHTENNTNSRHADRRPEQ